MIGGGERANKHPNEGSVRARSRMEDSAPQTQEMHGKSNIFPRAFKLRYLCDYWELEAEIKTGERFRFVFYFLISIRLDLLSWIVNQTGFSHG